MVVEIEEEIPEELIKQLLVRVEYLKNTPVENHFENHFNDWEYGDFNDFNDLNGDEQLMVAYEDLFGKPKVNDNEELEYWCINS